MLSKAAIHTETTAALERDCVDWPDLKEIMPKVVTNSLSVAVPLWNGRC